MKKSIYRSKKYFVLLPVALAAQLSLAEPAQKPMLSTLTGAKPNVVIMLDNSGSMGAGTTATANLPTRVDGNGNPVDPTVTGNANIFNNYYRRRFSATATSLGGALSNPEFDNKFRLGWGAINSVNNNGGQAGLPSTALVQGVSEFTGAHKINFYNWLYNTYSTAAFNNGLTPLHNAVNLVGMYYQTDQPWQTSATNTEKLSCRKSYNILLTDGAWNVKRYAATYNAAALTNMDAAVARNFYLNTVGGADNRSSVTYTGKPDGIDASFSYNPLGKTNTNTSVDPDNPATQGYVPYGDNIASGLSDLTAWYFWHRDLQPSVANNVSIKKNSGDPSFWQNMKSFVIGYQVASTSFTLNGVETYRDRFLAGLSPTSPTWPAPNSCAGNNFGFFTQGVHRFRWCWSNRLGGQGSGRNWYWDPTLSRNWNTGGMGWIGDAARIDDALHAGYTGGGRSYSVTTPQEVSDAFSDILSGIVDASGSDAGVAVSSGSADGINFLEGDLKITVDYDIKENAGDIVAYRVNANGDVINRDGSAVLSGQQATPSWSANDRLPAAGGRRLFVRDGGVQTITSSSALSAFGTTNVSLLNSSNYFRTDDSLAGWLLGETGKQNAAGENLRELTSGIAAIVNAAPVYAGANLDMAYDWALEYANKGSGASKTEVDSALQHIGTSTTAGSGTAGDFFQLKKSAPATIYAATNSGVVHVLNGAKPDPATGNGNGNAPVGRQAGEELAAYLPSGAMHKMAKFAGDGVFEFEYATDGPIAEGDVYDSGRRRWRQMLFGTGGRGGNFAYALNAINLTSDRREPGASDFMWEQRAAGGAAVDNLRFVSNSVTVGQLRDKGGNNPGEWVALVSSGHYPEAGDQVGLYVLDALTGDVVDFIALPATYTTGNRGLGGVTAVRDAGRRLVAAYAGDANGNLWRFDLRDQDNLGLSYDEPLFSTRNNKPIYAAPTWQPHIGGTLPNGTTCEPETVKEKLESEGKDGDVLPDTLYYGNCGTMIGFGTGILLEDSDAADTQVQTLYGIWDPTPIGGDDVAGYSTLEEVNATTELVEQEVLQTGNSGNFFRVTKNTVDYAAGQRGWFMNMTMGGGERVIGDPFNLGSSFFFTSVVADASSQVETCEASSSLPNVLYGLDAHTGGLKRSFDADGDGKADEFGVGYFELGGYTRSNAVRAGSAAGDAEYPYTKGPTNEGLANLRPEADCTDTEGRQTGVANETQKIYDGCGGGDWQRNWRQILDAPN